MVALNIKESLLAVNMNENHPTLDFSCFCGSSNLILYFLNSPITQCRFSLSIGCCANEQ